MRAKVIIYDDENNDCPKGAYELTPYEVQDNGISTKYLFEFEYNKLNRNFYQDERKTPSFSYGDISETALQGIQEQYNLACGVLVRLNNS